MTTFVQVVDRARRRLLTSHRESFNTLSSGIDDNDTSFSLAGELKGIGVGTRLDVDLEEMYVSAVSGTVPGSTVTVIRGLNSSTAAAHSAGAVVRVNSQWTNFEIGQAVNDELASLSAPTNGLFRIRSTDFVFTPSQMGYELTGLSDFLDVWRVRYDMPGPTDEWPVLGRQFWYIDQDADTAEFPSGVQLVLRAGGFPGHTVRVSYRATFDPLSSPSDDVFAVSGLHNEAHDILSLGAALRVMTGHEASRSYLTAQPNPRRSEEVPSGAASRALAPLVASREQRIAEERARLARRFPESL